MNGFSSLRVRLAGTVLLAMTPACALLYFTHLPWTGFLVGAMALCAAWYGGEHFILRQIRVLSRAARRLAQGDLGARTGLAQDKSEMGHLARTFDEMTLALQRRATEREESEKSLLQRSLQQTVLGALGQFALVSGDLPSLLNQVVLLVGQTLEVEYCHVLRSSPDRQMLSLLAGVGWKGNDHDHHTIPSGAGSMASFCLKAGEPMVIQDLNRDPRFLAPAFLREHRVTSGCLCAIAGHSKPFGMIAAHTARPRRFTEDEVHFLSSVATLLAMSIERHRANAELQKLAAFAQLNPNPAMELTDAGALSYSNDAALKLSMAVGEADPKSLLPADICEIVRQCLETKQSRLRYESQLGDKTLSWAFHPVCSSHVVHAYVEDITDRLSLEAQLRQSQKMESIGQLAAGVAHDFNNMLTIIQGHAGMLMTKPTLAPELSDSVQAVYFAAERAASLTRQLLMFSRKNVMQPTQVDLRNVVTNMSKMLERLLGETVKLELEIPGALPRIQGDVGMIEQVLMNFAVNARDAMADGGTLAISTSEVEVNVNYAATHPEGRPGSFVCLRARDTGCGMDNATMRRIFEPFFTTKEVGKGTGLGLATVYGIVKQHGGWIDVASEVGQGTSFSVFFPATSEAMTDEPAEPVALSPHVRGGQETILVVEDEPVLRDMANLILSDCGYRVLEAGTGAEAMNVWNRHNEEIHLLLTDMVMPEGMSGMDLAQKLLGNRPQLKIIFASGYSMDDLDPAFVRQGKAAFLQKPYTHVSLSKAVRECLDA